MPLIFYDLETTGLNPYHSRIIEIGAVKYENGNKSTFSELVNPEVKLSHFTINFDTAKLFRKTLATYIAKQQKKNKGCTHRAVHLLKLSRVQRPKIRRFT